MGDSVEGLTAVQEDIIQLLLPSSIWPVISS